MNNPIAVSSWSLHRVLGLTYQNGPAATAPHVAHETFGVGTLALEDLPNALRQHGYDRLELCHFHLASQAPDYLADLRARFDDAEVQIQTLLIDDGDITNPETVTRDSAWIDSWIKTASVLGAKKARVIAGKAKPSASALNMAISSLAKFAKLGATLGVRVVTENWFDLLASPKEVHAVLDGVGPELGFLADMGNWQGPTKYADLASIFARAELCHAKAGFAPKLELDSQDYGACLQAAQKANYQGPYTLIFADDGDEWQGLEIERAFIAAQHR